MGQAELEAKEPLLGQNIEEGRLTPNKSPFRKFLSNLTGEDEEDIAEGSTETQAISTTFRAVVGTGILALPAGIKAAGLIAGVVGLCLLCCMSMYTMKLLIRCVEHVREESDKSQMLKDGGRVIEGEIEYTDLGYYAYGRAGEIAITFCAVTCQIGCCISYLIFIGGGITDVITSLSDWKIILILLPVYGGLCLMRSTTYLAPTSHLGNLALVIGIVAVYWYGAKFEHIKSFDEYTFLNVSGLPVFFGLCVFTSTAHCEAVSIEQNMAKRERFPVVVSLTYILIIIVYLAFAVVAYLFFGDKTDDIILKNLVDGGEIIEVVKGCLCMSLLFQFPITMFPANVILEQAVFGKPQEDETLSTSRFMLRIFIVSATAGLAIALPDFTLVTSFVGSFSNGLVAYILPPMLYLKFYGDDLPRAEKYLVTFVFAVGTLGSLYSSVIVFLQLCGVNTDF